MSCPLPHRPKERELDELWTFVGRKRRKKWLWLAVERHTRRIVAWVLGSRGRATARRLWRALPVPYRTGTWYHTDEWEAYRGVRPVRAHRAHPKGSGQTSIVEAINCSLRQKCAVLVRKTCSFSRCLAMHHVRIQLVIDEHNRRCTIT
ncbi:IS1 family transposase [Hymenobacter metallilatus]|uniref:IS1 family transposase n=1 Tax=Hymenobacter metallilatus TaxID=2493666 RepID=A0A428IXI5_9BACT|nr:IS1 family transposase [Hymenobacter metallilatus]